MLMWRRTDVPGSEAAVLHADEGGLVARGQQQAVDPVPYLLRYELMIADGWTTTHLVAYAEGAGWTRELELTRINGRWSCRGDAHGAPRLQAWDGQTLLDPARPGFGSAEPLSDAVDVDLGGSPLTNALPVHRLRLLQAPTGHVERSVSAWVLPPTLEVRASAQTYTVLGGNKLRFGDAGTEVDIEYDQEGWVQNYAGLAVATHEAPSIAGRRSPLDDPPSRRADGSRPLK
jgi:hypothetical protein